MSQNFSGQDLRGQSFAGQNLTGADFSLCDLRGADFSNATLVGANFSQARIGLLPFTPRRAIAYAFSHLGFLSFILGVLMTLTSMITFSGHSLLSINTQFIKAYLSVPGVTLFAVLNVWFFVKRRQSHQFKAVLVATITMIVAGGIVITGTTIVAGEALVTAVITEIIWTFLGAWISVLTLDLPTKRHKLSKSIVFGILGINILAPALLFNNDLVYYDWGLTILWPPFVGYILLNPYCLSSKIIECDGDFNYKFCSIPIFRFYLNLTPMFFNNLITNG